MIKANQFFKFSLFFLSTIISSCDKIWRDELNETNLFYPSQVNLMFEEKELQEKKVDLFLFAIVVYVYVYHLYRFFEGFYLIPLYVLHK